MMIDDVIESQTDQIWSHPNAVMLRALQLSKKHHKNCDCHVCRQVRGDICECALCLRERQERMGNAVI